ncbi:MAG: organic hydroperoxide resistance protein [Phycisphaerales bacterium]
MPATLDKVLYTARAHTTGGREGGKSRTDDGRLEVSLTPPGGPGKGTNPEQLFAVGWSACYLSAIKLLAGQKKIKLPDAFSVDAEIDLGQNAGGYQLSGRLNVSLPGIDRAVAQELADQAHQICPYSKAVRNNIDVEINLV